MTKYKYRTYLTQYNSVEKFISSKNEKQRTELQSINQDAVIKRMKSEQESYIIDKKDQAISNLINKSGWVIVSIIFWIFHLLMYKRNANTLTQ